MAKLNSLTVLTVVSTLFTLQACSEGIPSADEALENLSNQGSSEVTDPPGISIGAASPTGTEVSIPVTPSAISNIVVNNITLLPASSPPPSTDEALEPDVLPETDSEVVPDVPAVTDGDVDPEAPPATDTEGEVDPEVPPATDTDGEVEPEVPPATDTDVVTETPPATDTDVVTETPPETDTDEVIEVLPETDLEVVDTIDPTPVLEAPVGGELVTYGSTIKFAWSIPVSLFGVVTGFDITMADASEGDVFYRNNLVSVSNCSYNGLCTFDIDSADLPIPEGDNIWSVSSIGEGVDFNSAVAAFTLDDNPEAKVADGLSISSPAAGFIADSASVDFEWVDLSKPAAVYDLHVYSDAARTQKVTGTNGAIFDTIGIGSATSYTFNNDPSDGSTRYGVLLQWPDSAYDNALREEMHFEYTAFDGTISPKGRLNNDPAFTDRAADIAKAMEYEDAFWNWISSFESNADGIGDDTNAYYYNGTYSGKNGYRFYHLYDDMFSLSKVLRLTHIERPVHAEKYKEIALRYVRENVSIFVNYTGLSDAPDKGDSVFVFATDRWRFLDGSRGLAWMAALMDALVYVDSDLATEMSGYANQLKPFLDQYLDRADDVVVAHMAAHPALASMILGRIGGYSDYVEDRVVYAMTARIADKVSPWNLTDISHAAQSEQALFYVYESNLRGQSLPGLAPINNSLITALADGAATRMNNKYYRASMAPYVESYGELVKFSAAIASHIGMPSDYGNNNDSRISLAHIAYGYAINSDF